VGLKSDDFVLFCSSFYFNGEIKETIDWVLESASKFLSRKFLMRFLDGWSRLKR